MDRLMNEMNSMMTQMRQGQWWETPSLGATADPQPAIESWQDHHSDLNLTIEATDEGYTVLADIPGFECSELDLQFDDTVLTIEGSHDTDDGSVARSRHLRKQVMIPGDVRIDDATAYYRNGVLEVTLPTDTEPADTSSRIEIEE